MVFSVTVVKQQNLFSQQLSTDADMQQKIEYMANAIAEVAVL